MCRLGMRSSAANDALRTLRVRYENLPPCAMDGMPPLKVEMSILDMPILIAILRREMAEIIRLGAEDEPPPVKIRLLEFAAVFETGQKENLDG